MKTTEIIIAQFKHINSNFKEYFKMAFPLIIGITIVGSDDTILDYIESLTLPPSIGIFIGIFLVLIAVYTLYLFFRNYINLHRFIILQDTSNYHSPLKKFKVTLFYILYLLLAFFFLMLVLFSCQILNELFPNSIIFQFGIGIMLLFLMVFIYPFYGLALPQIAIGKKISLRKIFKESKGTKETLFYQFLIFYVPLWFIEKIFEQQTNLNQTYLYNFIYALLSVYATAMFVGCLSRTYVLWKENLNKKT